MADVESGHKSKQTKKRIRNPSEWKREKRKRLRIAGKEYVNSKGDIVSERRIGDDCKCRRKCYKLVSEDQRHKLFDGYYSLNSHDEQNAYLFGLIRKHDIARKRCKDSDRRTCSYKYYVRIRGKEVQICRLAFAHIHGISPHKIRILCQKQDQNVMFPRDGRGKHNNRPRKISVDTLGQIREHIYSIMRSDRVQDFLKEEKHSGPDVNITKMWKDYLEKYDPNFSELCLGNEKGSPHPRNGVSMQSDILLSNFHGSQAHEMPDSQQLETYSSSVDLSQYQLPTIADNLGLIDHHTNVHYENREEDEDSGHAGDMHQSRPAPIVKHWLYSKVFHEEFKLHDFLSLKKKLWLLKDSSKSVSQQGKAERKQKTPKKISRDKDVGVNIVGVQAVSPAISDQPTVQNAAHHHHFQNFTASQGTDMYILPVNLQDLSQLPQATDVLSQQHHAMQLNLHTFSTQANMLSPLVNVQGAGPGQGIQCSSMVTLPAGALSLTQNSCGYMNVSAAAFYQ
ncbi:uncharacterized protein [Anabrus simplex]|uniref:uncharacterized protein n=1 Tax=Anabrus simplex TaxID=316456 RepID=UPI0034DD6653